MNKIVTLPYDPEGKPLDWAIKHCPSYITNDIHLAKYNVYSNHIDYYFSDERDVVLFTLRWL